MGSSYNTVFLCVIIGQGGELSFFGHFYNFIILHLQMKYWDIIWVTKLRYPPATDVWLFAIFDTFHSNWNVSNERMFSTNGSSNESNLPMVMSSNKQDVLNIHFSFKEIFLSKKFSVRTWHVDGCCCCRGARWQGDQSLGCHNQEAQSYITHVVMKSSHREMQIVREN